jgi:UDP-galactopyranose mutase
MNTKKYDFLIVGGGLYGLTFNYLARKNGYTCLIVEKRDHIGGNLYTPIIDGIPIHVYGPHIFHTHSKEVWDFVCTLCDMVPFINSPIAIYNDEVYNLPFNMNTFSKLFNIKTPLEAKEKIESEIKEYGVAKPNNLEEQSISLVGKTVYETLIKGYTEKQWGKKCSELPPEIIKRLPIRFIYDNNYFNDKYQGIPKNGYGTLIDNLLCDTEVIYDDYLLNREYYNSLSKHIIYTGPIDAYFNYSEGPLEWRSVYFELEKHNIQNYQGNAVVNYTSNEIPFTRIIEHKFFDKESEFFNQDITFISKEYSTEWCENKEPYYPLNDTKNNEIYAKYFKKSLNEPNVTFGGRLGCYKYYDMDDIIINVFDDFAKINNKKSNLNVWVVSHKDDKDMFEYCAHHKQIHVNSDSNPITRHDFKDNVGDNISFKNPYYCELTAMYWVWKNYNESKYVGFEHYRRHFNLSENDVEKILEDKDVILPVKSIFPMNVYEQYVFCHNEHDIKTIELIIKDLFPEYLESWDKYIKNSEKIYACNMFITSKEKFDELMNFLFTIFNEFEIRCSLNNHNSWINHVSSLKQKEHKLEYQLRFIGFLSERLMSLWFQHNFDESRIYECNIEL